MRNGDLSLVASMLLLAATPASAQDWNQIGESTTHSAFVDVDSVRVTGATVRLWIKWVAKAPRDGIASSLALYEVSCAEMKIRYLSFTDYNNAGEVVGSPSNFTSDWQYAAPGTVNKSLVDGGCLYADVFEAERRRLRSEQ